MKHLTLFLRTVFLLLALTGCEEDAATPDTQFIDASMDYALPPLYPNDPVYYDNGVSACHDAGWEKGTVDTQVGSVRVRRKFLWQAPANGNWSKGMVLILHGGGGNYSQWCQSTAPIYGNRVVPQEAQAGLAATQNQVAFSENLLNNGFAVFLLDSADFTRDQNTVLCGKIWDDEVRPRPNHDIPYIRSMIEDVAPALRPQGGSPRVFITGLSSGGFMSTRFATQMPHLITAFAPVASADPYGMHRDCAADSPRLLVAGVGLENATNQNITQSDACVLDGNEEIWPSAAPQGEFLKIHHRYDGVVDLSCHQKIMRQLQGHGFTGSEHLQEADCSVLQPCRKAFLYHQFLTPYQDILTGFFLSYSP